MEMKKNKMRLICLIQYPESISTAKYIPEKVTPSTYIV